MLRCLILLMLALALVGCRENREEQPGIGNDDLQMEWVNDCDVSIQPYDEPAINVVTEYEDNESDNSVTLYMTSVVDAEPDAAEVTAEKPTFSLFVPNTDLEPIEMTLDASKPNRIVISGFARNPNDEITLSVSVVAPDGTTIGTWNTLVGRATRKSSSDKPNLRSHRLSDDLIAFTITYRRHSALLMLEGEDVAMSFKAVAGTSTARKTGHFKGRYRVEQDLLGDKQLYVDMWGAARGGPLDLLFAMPNKTKAQARARLRRDDPDNDADAHMLRISGYGVDDVADLKVSLLRPDDTPVRGMNGVPVRVRRTGNAGDDAFVRFLPMFGSWSTLQASYDGFEVILLIRGP
jgi:hypothetical protein